MTDLIFVGTRADMFGITIAFNRITKITKVVNGIPQYTTLEGLQLSVAGILKDHPDLKGMPIHKIKRIGLKRLKQHLLKLETEENVINYIKEDLRKHGYKLQFVKKPGHRTKIIK